MPKQKRSIEELSQADQLTLSEIARLFDISYGTAQHYMNEGLLTFEQKTEGATRYFNRQQAKRKIAKINQLKQEGLKLSEIAERLTKAKTIILNEDQQRHLRSILSEASKARSSKQEKKKITDLKKAIFA